MFAYTHGVYETGKKIAKQMKDWVGDQGKCPNKKPKFMLQKACTTAGGYIFPSLGVISSMFFISVKYC